MLCQVLYSSLTAAILWYETLTNTLLDNGFKLNPCDMCVANSQVNSKQCTIIYHIDDTKVSHIEPEVVTNKCF